MISLAGVEKRYGQVVALAPTSLEVAAGERLAVVGPSGCGKSTLLRTIVGLVVPDGGEVTIFGAPLTAATAGALRLRLGYVIQEGGLFPHLTNLANVTLLARRRGWEPARLDARVSELSTMMRLDRALLRRYPSQSSGGERQRVGLMRALMLDPDVLLLDEPTASLDPMVRARLQGELLELMDRLSKCVVLVTHDLGEAAALGHHVALMRSGRIVQRGTLEDLRAAPAEPFVVDFLRAQRGVDRVA